jgi:hypothetical protein
MARNIEEDWNRDVLLENLLEISEELERVEDGGKTSLDKAHHEASEVGDESNDEENDEADKLPTAIEDMRNLIDTTRITLERARNAVNTLNSRRINVHFGTRKVQITMLESLEFFWNNVPDTPCLICGGNFGAGEWPPIRTASMEFLDPENTTHVPIRVRNRHLDCIRKDNVKYYTVSHAWNKDIAVANKSGKSSTEASISLMEGVGKNSSRSGSNVRGFVGPSRNMA